MTLTSLLFQALRRPHPPARSAPLSSLLRRLRWQIPLVGLLLVLLHQAANYFLLPRSLEWRFAIEVAVYGLAGPALLWWLLGWVARQIATAEEAQSASRGASTDLARLRRRVAYLLRVTHQLAQAADEAEVAALALRLPGEIVPAVVGAALIRFDDHHQPMPVEYRGVLDEASVAAWHRYLASAPVRTQCAACREKASLVRPACPVFEGRPLPDAGQMLCLPLERHGRQFAVLGLFLEHGQALAEVERNLLDALAVEVAIALENSRLRAHERVTLNEVSETLQRRLDSRGLMGRLLRQAMTAAHAQAGLLLLREVDGSLAPHAQAGGWEADFPPEAYACATAALLRAGGEVSTTQLAEIPAGSPTTAALCLPLVADGDPIGVMVLGRAGQAAELEARAGPASAVAAQAALFAEYARMYAQLEHQAIVAERGRLAREMHDGLAQTLGFIKMRAGQIARWVEERQPERARSALIDLGAVANEAYLDLRATLDGLRLPAASPDGGQFLSQLRRIALAFERQAGVALELDLRARPRLSLSAQAHLLRLTQESLNNIRKHASAQHVCLRLFEGEGALQLLIEDDGLGFEPERDRPETRHGLRVMQERAELAGAELRVTSAPGRGTQVCLTLSPARAPNP